MRLPSLQNRWGFFLVALFSGGAGILSVILTETLHLHPCPLCIAQRALSLVIALLALTALLRPKRLWCLFLAAISLMGLGIALYQSWLQWFPENALGCGSGEPNLLEQFVTWLGKLYPLMFKASGLCSSKEWTLLGLSLANFSALLFLLLLALCLWMARTRWRRKSIFS